MKGFHVHADEDDGWRCRKHPAAQPPTGGVCPVCLRARLLRLCPDCAGYRPCGCSSSCPSTSSSSLSSLSSLDIPRYATAAGARVGAVGRVAHLIDSEPAFRRSRSAAFRLLWPRQHDVTAAAFRRANATTLQHADGGGGWSRLWPFPRGKEATEEGEKGDAAAAARLWRSRSAGLVPGAHPDPGGIQAAVRAAVGGGGDVRGKAWNRYFPSPMKAFRHRKTSKVVEASSPLCRG